MFLPEVPMDVSDVRDKKPFFLQLIYVSNDSLWGSSITQWGCSQSLITRTTHLDKIRQGMYVVKKSLRQ